MARTLGIAGIQMNVVYGKDNTAAMLQKLDVANALFPWVEIFFFSELCISGVNMKLALPVPNSSLDRLAAWAQKKNKWLIPGSIYEKDIDRIYNTAVVISPTGEIIAKYRKIFPWRPLEESDPGHDFCIFDIPGKGRFGLCICYDQWFPELARTLAWMGAEAVFCPTATTTPDRTQEIVMAQSNAIANQMYWFSLNGLGAGGIGQSVFIDPEGKILQRAAEGERIMTEIIDLDLVSRVRQFGTVGQCQLWKSLGNFKGKFPVYQENISSGELFKHLGPLTLYDNIGD